PDAAGGRPGPGLAGTAQRSRFHRRLPRPGRFHGPDPAAPLTPRIPYSTRSSSCGILKCITPRGGFCMGEQTRAERPVKHICVGLLAHVDSGKTTLAEGLLYRAGALRRLGRVDHRDAFLDTDAQERARGITIFAKQAVLTLPAAGSGPETCITLLD